MKKVFKIVFVFFIALNTFAQNYKIIESTDDHILLNIDFSKAYKLTDTLINNIQLHAIKSTDQILRIPGEPALPNFNLNIGIPPNSKITASIINSKFRNENNIKLMPYINDALDGSEKLKDILFEETLYNQNRYFPNTIIESIDYVAARYSNIANVQIAPMLYNPVSRQLLIYENVTIRFDFVHIENNKSRFLPKSDYKNASLLRSLVINPKSALKWQGEYRDFETDKISDDYWYDPGKEYYKIFVDTADLFRITFEDLSAAGFASSDIDPYTLELYSAGEVVPIEVEAGPDGLFNSGDYLNFFGTPAPATPGAKNNIYNTENIYWLSFNGDSTNHYIRKNGFPNNNFDKTFRSTLKTVHYEKDTLYERFGYADDLNRDFWQWGGAAGDSGKFRKAFAKPFPNLKDIDETVSEITVRVNMHGLTTGPHKAEIELTSQYVGETTWIGQNEATFEQHVSVDTIGLFPINNLQVLVKGGIPPNGISDEVRINWFEFDYMRVNRAQGKKYSFQSSPGESGRIRYNVSYWLGSDLKIFVPSKHKIIENPQFLNDQFNTTLFVDSLSERTLYFCASSDYYRAPKRIEKHSNSDLRNVSNGADYILLIHPDFASAANQLAAFRSTNLKGFENPRVIVVDVFDVYDEFSFGLLDPEAIRTFVKYTFENWSGDAPSYLAILGDMSWDYRKLIPSSRPNFIPSYPYHGTQFGLSASDNMFGAVVGDDVIPDLAIGRISCESVEEAEILVNKIINYPADDSKNWKQNILFIGGGESQNDEARFGFNDQSLLLDNNYIIPQGYTGEKIFAFPDTNKPEHKPFLGNTPEIRSAFSRGTVMANFYGHGGGYQWDAVFLNDDIALLNNQDRLPFISSITCYTAHFDNQEVFGEQFNSYPGKGSIAFWGHTGITFWAYGLDLNKRLYNEIFNQGVIVLGDAIRIAKSKVGNVNSKLVKDHIALLTLLGDPAIELALPENPDFYVNSSDISISPTAPLTRDTVIVKAIINNIGRVFPGDSVKVEVYDQFNDSTFFIGSKYLYNFGYKDSLTLPWYPKQPGLHVVKVEVNNDGHIIENDISDNVNTAQFSVFNLDNPNIVSPINGSKWKDQVNFSFADVGEFISKELTYFIEIDTSYLFQNPIFQSNALTSSDFGEVKFQSEILPNGVYFWRSRISENNQFSNWSKTRTFTIADISDEVSSTFASKQLQLFNKSNLIYSPTNQALVLNLEPLPPKPMKDHQIENIAVTLPADLQGLSALTNDGTYFYVGHMAYYGQIDPDFTEESKIYKYGTGNGGSVKGQLYGEISPIALPIWKQIFYYENGIYIPTGDAFRLIRMDVNTGDTTSVSIPPGLINERAKVEDGAFYVCTDGVYVYNVAYRDESGNQIYTLRVLDPTNNWSKVGEDVILSGSSYSGFSSFFVALNNLYVYEKNFAGFLRVFSLDTYIFDDEWLSNSPYAGYFAWSYDRINDKVYAGVFVNGNDTFDPNITVFKGTFNQAFGNAVSPEVGPVKEWKTLTHEIDSQGSLGEYSVYLEGFNSQSSSWDTVNTNFGSSLSLENIDASIYSRMRTSFSFQDTTTAGSQPIKLKNLSFDFESIPELLMTKNYFSFEDSLLQGFPVKVNLKVKNVGYTDIDSTDFLFYLNDNESVVHSTNNSIKKDSIVNVNFELQSDNLLFTNKLKAFANINEKEFYNFNNLIVDDFYVARDSVKPDFQITFDGLEIISGDIVSATPNIFISLKDNSPLPIDTSNFFIYLNNNPLSFAKDSLKYSYTEYPNSESQINWQPNLINGKHVLDVLAKDASGNFFDTTSYRVSFEVNRENKVYDIYNYPNPFADETYFTFNISGTELPEEMNIKIFTVAGRLIRDFEIPVIQLGFGFNKFYWDGKDQDGNSIANGVYFCKFNILNNGEYSSEVKKIAKVK